MSDHLSTILEAKREAALGTPLGPALAEMFADLRDRAAELEDRAAWERGEREQLQGRLEALEENFDQAVKSWARLSELIERSYDFTEYCSFCQRAIGEHAKDCKLVVALFPVAIADAHPDQPLPR